MTKNYKLNCGHSLCVIKHFYFRNAIMQEKLDKITETTIKLCVQIISHLIIKKSSNFSLHNEYFMWPLCTKSPTGPGQMPLLEGAKSSAEFYVFVGVFVFLYCLAALALYLLFDELYRSNSNIVTAVSIIGLTPM